MVSELITRSLASDIEVTIETSFDLHARLGAIYSDRAFTFFSISSCVIRQARHGWLELPSCIVAAFERS